MSAAGRLCVLFLVLFVAGCAVSGPKFREAGSAVTPIAANMGRIYLYRAVGFAGGGVRPPVIMDGVVVGQSLPGSIFYKDVSPGTHRVMVMTETTKTLDVDVASGQSKYIRMEPAFGWFQGRIVLTPVDESQAQTEIQDLAVTEVPPGLAPQ